MNPKNRSQYNKIKTGLKDGLYKGISLWRINPEGELDLLIPYNRFGDQKGIDRLNIIQNRLETNSAPGTYIIKCRAGLQPTSVIDEFEIIIKGNALPPSSGSETHNKETIHNLEAEIMTDIDPEHYQKLIEENADLKAQVKILNFQLNWQQQNTKPLGDGPEKKSTVSEIFSALSDQAPAIMGAWDAYLQTRNREIDLKERQLSSNSRKNTSSFKIKTKKSAPPNREEILQKMIALESSDEDSFNATLDEMEREDPALFDYICTQMNLFEEEEEEQEGEEQE